LSSVALVALLGASLVLVGTFLPIHRYSFVSIPRNSFASDGNCWLIGVAVLVGATAVRFLTRAKDCTPGR
jgi:hypothetical protein